MRKKRQDGKGNLSGSRPIPQFVDPRSTVGEARRKREVILSGPLSRGSAKPVLSQRFMARRAALPSSPPILFGLAPHGRRCSS